MRTFLPFALLLIGLALVACGPSGASAPAPALVPADPAGPVIVLAVPEGHDVAAIAETVDARLQAASLGRADVAADEPRRVRCRLIASLDAEDAEDVAARIGSRGVLEFRIQAVRHEIRTQLAERKALGEFYRAPSGRRWLQMLLGGGDVLVEIPEAEAAARLEAAREAGEDAAVLSQLQEVLDGVRAEHVFGGEDVAEARRVQMGVEFAVHFQIEDTRRAAFQRFTEAHRDRYLAIVLDGRVESVPRIMSPLPGEGVISGGGGPGFSRAEADLLAAILDGDLTLPVELELVRIEAPPEPSGDPR